MPSRLERLPHHAAAFTGDTAADLRVFLSVVPDPRGLRGRRYPALALLCAAATAVLAGARSRIAIGEWIADAPQSALSALGFPADPLTGIRTVPHPGTVRRLLQRLDGDALDAAIDAYLQARAPLPPPAEPAAGPALRAIAVDGKTIRGSRTAPPRRSNSWQRWTTTAWSWPSGRSTPRATRSPPSHPCWTPST